MSAGIGHSLHGLRSAKTAPEVAVFDLPDDRWVQKVVAAVVPRSASLDPQALLARARQKLAGYKCPKEIFVTDRLPKNAAGKVLRKVLREDYRDRAAVNGIATKREKAS